LHPGADARSTGAEPEHAKVAMVQGSGDPADEAMTEREDGDAGIGSVDAGRGGQWPLC
jgi:hypothetical protein